ncbi:hypothetical protein STSP2_02276 [Anaerohalosphaera lusitana]|uniref:Uncharacterized protein n=1 Tax=Anaerohalosphaera lusitana TaxID=1936003 RepID=A0A1U9NMF3_9BACT|nr:hypothetical protein [Anaerohalosphaera lusitana]AQT69089.1 hypothetical protein STSP2_02276 [Anaerohalosphaera lusitana]
MGENAYYAVITSGGVYLCDTQNLFDYFLRNARATGFASVRRTIVLLSHQLAIPAKHCVRLKQRWHIRLNMPPQDNPFGRQSPPLGISQLQSLAAVVIHELLMKKFNNCRVIKE